MLPQNSRNRRKHPATVLFEGTGTLSRGSACAFVS